MWNVIRFDESEAGLGEKLSNDQRVVENDNYRLLYVKEEDIATMENDYEDLEFEPISDWLESDFLDSYTEYVEEGIEFGEYVNYDKLYAVMEEKVCSITKDELHNMNWKALYKAEGKKLVIEVLKEKIQQLESEVTV